MDPVCCVLQICEGVGHECKSLDLCGLNPCCCICLGHEQMTAKMIKISKLNIELDFFQATLSESRLKRAVLDPVCCVLHV